MKRMLLHVLPLLLGATVAHAAPEAVRVQFGGPPIPGFRQPLTGKGTPKVFSTRLPEGNYRVTLTLASDVPAETTVKAEARRLMLECVPTTPGETVTRSFIVNIRTPALPDGGAVKAGGRQALSWDDELSLEFLSSVPTVRTIEIVPDTTSPTIYLAGDSTVCDQPEEPWYSWGQALPRFFKSDIAVANHAESGRALRSFRAERRFDKILSTIKPGDYLFIQFGHNDMKEKGDGIGAFTSFKKDLEQYVQAARAKGATPVLVTSMYRRRFSSEGQLQDSLGDYPTAMRKVAEEQHLQLIDLHKLSGQLFQALGPDGTTRAFVHYPANTFPNQDKALADDSHFNTYGGYELARCIAEAIRTSDSPLKQHLVDDLAPFDPNHPDPVESFHVPASPPRPTATPEGN